MCLGTKVYKAPVLCLISMYRFLSPLCRRDIRGGILHPKNWDEITMISMDIVNFTENSAKMESLSVCALLTSFYGFVDRLAAEYGVDKIDIVGDAYVAISANPDDAMAFSLACVSLAKDTVWDALNPDRGCLNLRCAVHTGKVTGLVLNAAPFKYTLVGETVVTAKFLETTAQPGSVSCSAVTARSLDIEQFTLIQRLDNPEVFSVLWAAEIQDTIVNSTNLHFQTITDDFLAIFGFTRKELVSLRSLFGPRTRVEAIQTAMEQCVQFTFPTSTAVVLYGRDGQAMCVALGFVYDISRPEVCVAVTCRRLPDHQGQKVTPDQKKDVKSCVPLLSEKTVGLMADLSLERHRQLLR